MDELSLRRLVTCRERIGAAQSAAWEPAQLGTVVLRAPQREAAARIRALLGRYHGCLLADDVGRGKTFVALAVARRWTRPLVVIPASLGDTWRLATRRAGLEMPFVTHEGLSRGVRPSFEPDGIIVDESHHFRNPATRRYAALADVSIRAELLLLSATPVQNSAADLAAQLRLILGGAVDRLGASRLSELVVRVASDDAGAGLPRVAPPRWVQIAVDDARVLGCILRLPPPPRALGTGDAGALRTIALVRAWASSRAALSSAVARRRRLATAIEQSIESGRMPTREEASAWRGGGDDVVQLGFAGLLASGNATGAFASSMRDDVAAEHEALSELSALLHQRSGVDADRAAALVSIVAWHPGASVLAFTEFSTTARAYHALLRPRGRVGLLTATGGVIASGRVSRREILARFAPVAQGCPQPSERERITLLISTDLLSEGVNLQDASVVVHLDLPWNPARLAQRLGRVRRPHGATAVASYLIAPPAGTEVLLDVESRLRGKLAEAQRMLARGLEVVPALTLAGTRAAVNARAGPVALRATVHARLREWAATVPVDGSHAIGPVVSGAVSNVTGWLALLPDGRMLASHEGDIGDDVGLVDRVTAAAGNGAHARMVSDSEVEHVHREIAAWIRQDRAVRDTGVDDLMSPSARRALRIAARCVGSASRHARPDLVALVALLRDAMRGPLTLGAERAVAALEHEVHGDTAMCVAWLRRVLAIVARAPIPDSIGACTDEGKPAALILLGPHPSPVPRTVEGAASTPAHQSFASAILTAGE